MKFDFVIGNPPYQEESQGDNENLSMPVYNKFMDAACDIADVVELIHPARFLTGVGRTPNEFTDRKLKDEHFKILHFESDASKIFPNTEIKGGVVISLENKNKNFGAIGTFISSDILKTAFSKVWETTHNITNICSMITPRLFFKYTDKLFEDFNLDIKKGPLHAVQSDAFDKNSFVFHKEKQSEDEIAFIGKTKGTKDRVWRYIDRKYILYNEYIDFWKVVMPRSSGDGIFGETLSQPFITQPNTGMTDSFICIGPAKTEYEANSILKYIKSKFARAMLGIIKNTQGNTAPVWRYVPVQDFTENSDIDWSVSMADIDKQLYKKYGLSQEEIDFIETNVKEME